MLNWSIIYGIFSFLSAAISISMAVILSPHWKNISARLLWLLVMAIAFWSFGYGMEYVSPSLSWKLWWVKFEYCGAVWVGMLVFCFIASVVFKKHHITWTGYFFLCIIPACVLILALTNPHHHLVWKLAWVETDGFAPFIAYKRGPAFWYFVVFSYGMLSIATLLLINALKNSEKILRRQLISVLVGISFPWFANALYLFGMEKLTHFDLTPAAFTISCIAFLFGLVRYQMLGLIPLAHAAVTQSMEDPVIVLDMNDRILDMNNAAYSVADQPDKINFPVRLDEVFPALYERICSEQRDFPVTTEICFGDEICMRHWELRLSAILNKTGKQTGMLIILRDITEWKKIQEALKHSERIHRLMLEASPNPIVFYDDKGRVTYLNPAFTRVFGWSFDELEGRRIDFVPPENMEETKQALKRTIERPEVNYNFITQRYTKTGKVLDVSINSAVHRLENSRVASMVVNFTDITQLKKAERELKATRDFIRNIINSMPSMLIGLDTDTIVTQWNTEAEKITGICAQKAQGRRLSDIFPQLSAHLACVMQVIEEKKMKKLAKVRLNSGKKPVLADITIYPIVSDQEKGAVVRVDDITERVRMEEMMIQSEKMLSVGGLAAGMAHEINNPLAGILQNVQVIWNRLTKDLPPNVEAARECGIELEALKAYMEKRNIFYMMELVKSSGRRAAGIVDNMLSFARKSEHRKSDHDICEIMESTLELVKSDYSMKKNYDFRSIKIEKDYKKDIPLISCEKSEIQQVFLNILKNGAQAMADAGVSSPAFVIRCYYMKGKAVVEIQDNGPGIEPETRKRIFEPFFTTKEVGAGTGLGLSVAYFIITENHQGTLNAESAPGKGTRFVIGLPAISGTL